MAEGSDPRDRQAAFQKGPDSHFVGSVEDGTGSPTGRFCLCGKRQGWITRRVWRAETPILEQIRLETLQRAGNYLGRVESVVDREAHVWRPNLGQNRTVFKLDHGVDDRLPVDEDGDPGSLNPEKGAGFQDLKHLVHHRCAIDRDPWAHRPVRVGERLLRSRQRQLQERHIPERTS